MESAKYKYGQRAKKSLGQNFLQDENIARKIVQALDIRADDRVMEIGPGPGALTEIILQSEVKSLCLVEKDSYWAGKHAQKFNVLLEKDVEYEDLFDFSGKIKVLEADALQIPWDRLEAKFKIIGNLPYNIASPLMWEIFSRTKFLEKAVFMVQREVAQRLVAEKSNKTYGALSVWVQSFFKPKLEFIVPPHVFHPQPKVHSAVVSFERLSMVDDFDKVKLSRLLKLCFQARRKQLSTILRSFDGIEKLLKSLDIDPRQRPETLSPKEFQALAEILFFEIH